jgi:hypothetical protein
MVAPGLARRAFFKRIRIAYPGALFFGRRAVPPRFAFWRRVYKPRA